MLSLQKFQTIDAMSELSERLKNIRMLVLDVDGVLTDCRVFMSDDGEWRRFFSIRDGYGIMLLRESGLKTAIITGSKARDIQERARSLKIDYFFEGHLEKLSILKELAVTSGIALEEMAYVGDDLFDIPCLQNVGFAATVPDAMDDVFQSVHYTTKRPAGNGAVREVCELLLKYSKHTLSQPKKDTHP